MSKKSKSKSNTSVAPPVVVAAAPALTERPPRWVLPALILVYSLLTLLLIVRVPLNSAPDEAAHIFYVQHLATTGSLPVFKPLGSADPGYEFHQPPLYYALCAPFWRAREHYVPGAGGYACRLVSLLCGIATLVFLWQSVVVLFPASRELPILAVGFAALWPMSQGVGASAGNGALAGLICAAIFWMIARASVRAWQPFDAAWLGILTGLGLLASSSCLAVAPAAVGAAWNLAGRGQVEKRRMAASLRAVTTVAGAALLGGGWWLARNQRLYGDPFAIGVFNDAFAHSSPGPAWFFAHGTSVLEYLRSLLLILFCTTWGIFGGPNTALSTLFSPRGAQPEVLLAALPMLICAAATVAALRGISRWAQEWRTQPAPTRLALTWWVAGGSLVALAWMQFNTHYFQAQARYFYPALLPLSLAFALGWREVWGGAGRERMLWIASGGFGITLLTLTLWNAFGWRTLV